MRPPVCEICDTDIDPADGAGGLVRFQPDDASRDWRSRAEAAAGFVGHPPDTGWFCGRHVDAARDAALTRSFADGVRHVASSTRHLDATTPAFPDPVDLPDGMAVPVRSSDALTRLLLTQRPTLVEVLGSVEWSLRSSSSFRLGDDRDRSIVHATVGGVDLFDRVDYRRIDGESVPELVESRVVRDGVLLALVRIGPFDRLRSWVGDEHLRPWVDAVVSAIEAPPTDLLDPGPDLVDVDLGSGRLGASDRFEHRWVQWDLAAVEPHDLARSLRSALPALFAAAGLGDPPPLESDTTRRWSPMDGAEPPYCPYTDTTTDLGADPGGTSVTIAVVLDHWNDDDVRGASVTLTIDGHVSISAVGANGGGSTITALRLYRPTTAAVVDVVARLAG